MVCVTTTQLYGHSQKQPQAIHMQMGVAVIQLNGTYEKNWLTGLEP